MNMEFNPKVSIVIPVYNGSNYMKEAIDSAIVQTYKNIEIIVINDGSTDDGKTDEIAKIYGDKIRYYCKENGGVASALNLGIQKMTGEYFSWLSHDDVYLRNKIKNQINYLGTQTENNILLYCDSEIIDEKSNKIKDNILNRKYLNNTYMAILSTSIGGCSLLIPKKCFEVVGLFNESLKTTQDNELWLRIAKKGFKFKYLPEILLKSRSHDKQGSKIMKDCQNNEKDNFYLWAIDLLDNKLNNNYHEFNKLLLKKKCHKAHRELLAKKHRSPIIINLKIFYYKLITKDILKKCKSIILLFSYIKDKYKKLFFKSSDYWEKRYSLGKNSGVGSYGELAVYKADIINSFIENQEIDSVMEFGCGDGNQLSYYKIKKYIGIDVSETAISICKDKYKYDNRKEFIVYNEYKSKKDEIKNADLTLSIDVLFHLVEDHVFKEYITELFERSDNYVIIYSTNFNKKYKSPHQLDREFTSFIQTNINNFKLVKKVKNPFKGDKTMSDFYIYKKLL